MKFSPLRLSSLVAAAACWAPIQDSQAALLVYEPFDYTSVAGSDQNGDGKKDLMGLAGGLGWSGAWTEITGATTAPATAPLDYVNSFDLLHPSGDTRFSSAGPGSLTIYGYNGSGDPSNQNSSTLTREFAQPFVLSEGTTVWLSVLLRKDFENPDSTGKTRPTDAFEIGLVQDPVGTGGGRPGVFMGDVVNSTPADSTTTFGLRADYSIQSPTYLEGSGPTLGKVNFLVMKLSIESGNNRLELFLNPSLDNLNPVPDLSMALTTGVINMPYTGLAMNMNGGSRPIWSVDEIRIGGTYQDVVPEPSSLLLASFGIGALGLSRFRRSQFARN